MIGAILLRVFFLFTFVALGMPQTRHLQQIPMQNNFTIKLLSLEEALKKSGDKQNQISEWKKVVEAYRKVYYNHPIFRLLRQFIVPCGRFICRDGTTL